MEFFSLSVYSRGKVALRHWNVIGLRQQTFSTPSTQRVVFVYQFKLPVVPIWEVSTMASKRRQGVRDATEKKKKKSCDETAELCSLLQDEQLKKDLSEAWSHKSHYSQGP